MAEKKKKEASAEEAAVETDALVETPVEAATEDVVEAAPAEDKAAKPKKKAPAKAVSKPKAAKPADSGDTAERVHKRAEKIGVVFSDKMEKSVVVRVDRTVKHPLYHKYMKKRKKFMAHNEMGAAEGDKVKIVETRPLSARKRWRVVEIIQKAQK